MTNETNPVIEEIDELCRNLIRDIAAKSSEKIYLNPGTVDYLAENIRESILETLIEPPQNGKYPGYTD